MIRSSSLAAALTVLLASGCGDGRSEEAPQSEDALNAATCDESERTLFFHGMSGYGRELAVPGVCAPSIASFWSDVAFVDSPKGERVVGYSAGRIPALRRLASGRGKETTAILLDPSYADGRRFSGSTGPEIVTRWLQGDPARRFVLVYSPTSVGWSEYAELARGDLSSRVRVCKVEGAHLDLPGIVGPKLLLETDAWLAERCR